MSIKSSNDTLVFNYQRIREMNSKICYLKEKQDFWQADEQQAKPLFENMKKEEKVSIFGAARGLGETVSTESKIMSEVAVETKAMSRIGRILKGSRGAAYMNDVGEGLKPAIGEALAKRCWYPSLIYVGASVYDKTFHDEKGNKEFSLKRGGQELAFQTLASLCGPILLVNLGQNTIGKLLSGIGSAIGMARRGKNPFGSISNAAFMSGTKNLFAETGRGILGAAKELPSEIFGTIALAFKDMTHPIQTCKKAGKLASGCFKAMKNIPQNSKNIFNTFKADKSGFIFGKNGILFGQRGLLGEKGILFGKKSGRVIGGLLAILLLYKAVDKAAAWIVGKEED